MTIDRQALADADRAVEEARDTLVDVVDFAYQMGFHEMGYNPIDALIAAVAARAVARVEGMRMEHTHDCNEEDAEAIAQCPFDHERLCICRAEVHNAALDRVLAALRAP